MEEAQQKPKKRVIGSSNRASLAFADELVTNEYEIDCFAGIDDQPVESNAALIRRKSLSRRRSSMGMIGSSLGDEQNAQIAEMYKTVIQLSTEGKLTEKNSWKYDLIDHMGKLIRDEAKGVNFQKASCTLDASVKIYSNRVDDTYTTSHRVLEALSRNNNTHIDILGDDGDDLDGGAESKPKAKVGSKASSTRLNIAQTIEKNPEAINAVKLEHDYAFDPMFHKLSRAFDEGGAKGMLLYNMRMSTKSCSLSFLGKRMEELWSAAESEELKEMKEDSRRIDMADLVARSGLTSQSLVRCAVCPKLAEFRSEVDITPSSVGIISQEEILNAGARTQDMELRTPVRATLAPALNSLSLGAGMTPVSLRDELPLIEDDGYDYEPADHEDLDYFDAEPQPLFVDAAPAAPPSSSSALAFDNATQSLFSPVKEKTKLAWSAPTEDEVKRQALQELENMKVSSGAQNDYAFFHVDDLISEDNSWAGARHWGYRTRSKRDKEQDKTAPGNESVGEDFASTVAAGEKSKPKKKTTKKDAEAFTLTLDLVDDELFGPTTKSRRAARTDVTRQTKAASEKNRLNATALLLPSDEKMKVQDLCRLFLLPKVVVPPKNMSILVRGSKSNAQARSGTSKARQLVDNLEGDDQLWSLDGHGITIKSTAPISVPAGSAAANADTEVLPLEERPASHFEDHGGFDDDDDYGGGNDYDNGDMPQFTSIPIAGVEDDESTAVVETAPVLQGLAINESKLIQATRKVEKIDVNYAKVSKRVDVHKLKGDVWTNIQDHLGSVKPTRRADTQPAAPIAPDMSFQSLVKDLSAADGQQQKDVSLAYYFICLLHLANENTLQINGQDDMADLTIKYDK